jgi:hypothetical protein
MAATKRTAAAKHAAATKPQDDDVISRLADKGEEAVRWVVGTPRRMVADVRGGVDARLHDLVSKLRAVDPLNARVTRLERRLASLETPSKKTTRRTATRARPTTTRQTSTAAGARDDATANNAEGADAPA